MIALLCTYSQKNCTRNSWLCFCQVLASFQNSFTRRFSIKFAVKWLLEVPPHHAYVATLPCEILDYINV